MRWWRTLSPAVTAAAMVATPLLAQRGSGRRVMSTVVVSGLFATTVERAIGRWGPLRAGLAAGSVAATTAAVERVGVRTGRLFGRYHYSNALQPQIGGVPVIVPMAWFAMAVPAREVAAAVLGERATPWSRSVLGAAALVAWDAFLDPQMTAEGYWEWEQHGAYRGIPLHNYLGWFVTGLGVMALVEVLIPVRRRLPPGFINTGAAGADPVMVGQYSFMAVMETIGFAAFFKDRLVAVVGGAAMLPISGVAAVRLIRGR
jgi:putative membrane protein